MNSFENSNPSISTRKSVRMPDLSGCKTDTDCIRRYLACADLRQLKIIRKNIERIFIYGA